MSGFTTPNSLCILAHSLHVLSAQSFLRTGLTINFIRVAYTIKRITQDISNNVNVLIIYTTHTKIHLLRLSLMSVKFEY